MSITDIHATYACCGSDYNRCDREISDTVSARALLRSHLDTSLHRFVTHHLDDVMEIGQDGFRSGFSDSVTSPPHLDASVKLFIRAGGEQNTEALPLDGSSRSSELNEFQASSVKDVRFGSSLQTGYPNASSLANVFMSPSASIHELLIMEPVSFEENNLSLESGQVSMRVTDQSGQPWVLCFSSYRNNHTMEGVIHLFLVKGDKYTSISATEDKISLVVHSGARELAHLLLLSSNHRYLPFDFESVALSWLSAASRAMKSRQSYFDHVAESYPVAKLDVAAAEYVPAQTLSNDVEWKAGTVKQVEGGLGIVNGKTLTIEENVTVVLSDPSSTLVVEGCIRILGSLNRPVSISSSDGYSRSLRAIHFQNGADLSCSTIRGAVLFGHQEAISAASSVQGNLELNTVSITNCSKALYFDGGSASMSSSQIDNSTVLRFSNTTSAFSLKQSLVKELQSLHIAAQGFTAEGSTLQSIMKADISSSASIDNGSSMVNVAELDLSFAELSSVSLDRTQLRISEHALLRNSVVNFTSIVGLRDDSSTTLMHSLFKSIVTRSLSASAFDCTMTNTTFEIGHCLGTVHLVRLKADSIRFTGGACDTSVSTFDCEMQNIEFDEDRPTFVSLQRSNVTLSSECKARGLRLLHTQVYPSALPFAAEMNRAFTVIEGTTHVFNSTVSGFQNIFLFMDGSNSVTIHFSNMLISSSSDGNAIWNRRGLEVNASNNFFGSLSDDDAVYDKLDAIDLGKVTLDPRLDGPFATYPLPVGVPFLQRRDEAANAILLAFRSSWSSLSSLLPNVAIAFPSALKWNSEIRDGVVFRETSGGNRLKVIDDVTHRSECTFLRYTQSTSLQHARTAGDIHYSTLQYGELFLAVMHSPSGALKNVSVSGELKAEQSKLESDSLTVEPFERTVGHEWNMYVKQIYGDQNGNAMNRMFLSTSPASSITSREDPGENPGDSLSLEWTSGTELVFLLSWVSSDGSATVDPQVYANVARTLLQIASSNYYDGPLAPAGGALAKVPTITSIQLELSNTALTVPGDASTLSPFNRRSRAELSLLVSYDRDLPNKNLIYDPRVRASVITNAAYVTLNQSKGHLFVNENAFGTGEVKVRTESDLGFTASGIDEVHEVVASVHVLEHMFIFDDDLPEPYEQSRLVLQRYQCTGVWERVDLRVSLALSNGVTRVERPSGVSDMELFIDDKTVVKEAEGPDFTSERLSAISAGSTNVNVMYGATASSVDTWSDSIEVNVLARNLSVTDLDLTPHLSAGRSAGTNFSSSRGSSGIDQRVIATVRFEDGTKFDDVLKDAKKGRALPIRMLLRFFSHVQSAITVDDDGILTLLNNHFERVNIECSVICNDHLLYPNVSVSLAANLIPPASEVDADFGSDLGVPITPAQVTGEVTTAPVRLQTGMRKLRAFHIKLEYDSELIEPLLCNKGSGWAALSWTRFSCVGATEAIGIEEVAHHVQSNVPKDESNPVEVATFTFRAKATGALPLSIRVRDILLGSARSSGRSNFRGITGSIFWLVGDQESSNSRNFNQIGVQSVPGNSMDFENALSEQAKPDSPAGTVHGDLTLDGKVTVRDTLLLKEIADKVVNENDSVEADKIVRDIFKNTEATEGGYARCFHRQQFLPSKAYILHRSNPFVSERAYCPEIDSAELFQKVSFFDSELHWLVLTRIQRFIQGRDASHFVERPYTDNSGGLLVLKSTILMRANETRFVFATSSCMSTVRFDLRFRDTPPFLRESNAAFNVSRGTKGPIHRFHPGVSQDKQIFVNAQATPPTASEQAQGDFAWKAVATPPLLLNETQWFFEQAIGFTILIDSFNTNCSQRDTHLSNRTVAYLKSALRPIWRGGAYEPDIVSMYSPLLNFDLAGELRIPPPSPPPNEPPPNVPPLEPPKQPPPSEPPPKEPPSVLANTERFDIIATAENLYRGQSSEAELIDALDRADSEDRNLTSIISVESRSVWAFIGIVGDKGERARSNLQKATAQLLVKAEDEVLIEKAYTTRSKNSNGTSRGSSAYVYPRQKSRMMLLQDIDMERDDLAIEQVVNEVFLVRLEEGSSSSNASVTFAAYLSWSASKATALTYAVRAISGINQMYARVIRGPFMVLKAEAQGVDAVARSVRGNESALLSNVSWIFGAPEEVLKLPPDWFVGALLPISETPRSSKVSSGKEGGISEGETAAAITLPILLILMICIFVYFYVMRRRPRKRRHRKSDYDGVDDQGEGFESNVTGDNIAPDSKQQGQDVHVKTLATEHNEEAKAVTRDTARSSRFQVGNQRKVRDTEGESRADMSTTTHLSGMEQLNSEEGNGSAAATFSFTPGNGGVSYGESDSVAHIHSAQQQVRTTHLEHPRAAQTSGVRHSPAKETLATTSASSSKETMEGQSEAKRQQRKASYGSGATQGGAATDRFGLETAGTIHSEVASLTEGNTESLSDRSSKHTTQVEQQGISMAPATEGAHMSRGPALSRRMEHGSIDPLGDEFEPEELVTNATQHASYVASNDGSSSVDANQSAFKDPTDGKETSSEDWVQKKKKTTKNNKQGKLEASGSEPTATGFEAITRNKGSVHVQGEETSSESTQKHYKKRKKKSTKRREMDIGAPVDEQSEPQVSEASQSVSLATTKHHESDHTNQLQERLYGRIKGGASGSHLPEEHVDRTSQNRRIARQQEAEMESMLSQSEQSVQQNWMGTIEEVSHCEDDI